MVFRSILFILLLPVSSLQLSGPHRIKFHLTKKPDEKPPPPPKPAPKPVDAKPPPPKNETHQFHTAPKNATFSDYLPPINSMTGPLTGIEDDHWDLEHITCATSPFSHLCAPTEFCYKNLHSSDDSAQCIEKRLPGTACGVFDKHYWPVACASLMTDSGDLQRFSCQAVKDAADEMPLAAKPTDETNAPPEMYMGDAKGMCLPCCDEGQEDCGNMVACPPDFSREQETLVVPPTAEVCISAKKGEKVYGCPEGPVVVDHDFDVCLTVQELEGKLKELKAEHEGFDHVVEELFPASREHELHEKMETGALFKAGICANPFDDAPAPAEKPAPPPPRPSAIPSVPKTKAKAKAAPPPKAKPAGKAKAAAKPAPKAAAEEAARSVGAAPSKPEQIPDTTQPTEADAIAGKAEALSASLLSKRRI